ncbi:hypothetical protein KAR02_05855, partial [Candidatus Bipolaricaulota bacterium]|nr:hypothetical protein [Candidatus Bipolaricaulota bacterium]
SNLLTRARCEDKSHRALNLCLGPGNCSFTLTIPIHAEVDVKHTVVELTEAERILREAAAISLGDCHCRKTNRS